MKEKTLWTLSSALSLLLLCMLIALWVDMNRYEIDTRQLVDMDAVDEFLGEHWPDHSSGDQQTIYLKTGLFIQSFSFLDSSEVNMSGYVWQRYVDGVHDAIKPGPGEAGFILPEQVNSGGDIIPEEVYRVRQDNEEVIGWYFEATIRQPFDYLFYPFDHKRVWVRMWAHDFMADVVLVPDFESYQATGLGDIFGIDRDIVLGTWERHNTFFDYRLSSYDTNFGVRNYIGQRGFPELQYNFIVKRKFENAFILYLLPLMLVAALLYASMLTVTGDETMSSRHDFSTSGFLGGASALFFVVLLAHIQLREQFAGTQIVYIEYFYILMYVMLALCTVSTYLFSMQAVRGLAIVHYRDNLIPKLTYWPTLLGAMVAITIWVISRGTTG